MKNEKEESKPLIKKGMEGVTKTVVHRSDEDPEFASFLELYRKDKLKARVLFFNGGRDPILNYGIGGQYRFETQQTMLFERQNGDFSYVMFSARWGLSVTGKMYKSERIAASVSYKKATDRFWLVTKSKGHNSALPLTLANMRMHFGGSIASLIVEGLEKKFSWVRFLKEKDITDLPFNTVVSKKLFSFHAALRHIYKVPAPVAEKLHTHRSTIMGQLHTKKMNGFFRYMENVENLQEEHIKSGIFWDAVKMARTLDRRVNCSWSEKRVKTEHDKWAKEITAIIAGANSRNLHVNAIYRDFAEFSGYELLSTTADLADEGLRNAHCVATYISSVDRGRCAIFRIEDHTLEVVVRGGQGDYLNMNQFRGFANKEAPPELKDRVEAKLEEFNRKKSRG